MSGVGDMLCRQCRGTDGSPQPESSGKGGSKDAEGDFRVCPRCGAPLTAEEQDDLLSRMLKKFGLLDEGGTVLERRGRSA